jgi:hypothetical protein
MMMKTFRQLTELTGTSHQSRALDKNINPGVFTDPEVLKKINSWVGQIAGSYVMPEEAVHQLRSSLLKIGLTFGEAAMEGNSGSVELPLTLYGGRFGKDTNTPHDEFMNDDGISHQVEGGLALVLNYEMNEDNSCRLTASIK